MERFQTDATTAPDNFFRCFNYSGALTSLPPGSFKLSSSLTTVGSSFFSGFNYSGALTSLPAGSFDTSAITTVGSDFFGTFNRFGKLTSLPTSFVFPPLDQTNVDKSGNFSRAFSSSYTRASPSDVAAILNGCATPTSDRNTFSSNQPGATSLPANWQV
jgi:surface protein